MGRPRKKENQDLPQNLLCRRRKRKNGTFIDYFFYVTSDKKEKSLGTDRYSAILEAAKLNYQWVKIPENVFFIDVAKRYQELVLPSKANNTIKANQRAIKLLCQFFGDPPAPLDKIEPRHIKQYLEWRKKTPAAANIDISVFNTIWNYARECGYTNKTSPSQGIKKYSIKFRDVYAEDFVLEKIYQCANQLMKDIIDTAYLLGQRPVDLCNIHKSHIHNNILHITQQKTGKKVRFEIVGKFKEIVERRLTNSDWLFLNHYNRKLTAATLSNYFKELRKKAMKQFPELANEIAKIQIRDMRAKAATDISLFANSEQAQKNLGHTSQKMTQHYIRKEKVLKPTDELL